MSTVTGEQLEEIVREVWVTVAGDGHVLVPADGPATGAVQGSVSVTGDWSGHVVLGLSPAAARRATATMLDLGVDEASEDDVVDAVGELANMVGGAVKSLVAQAGALSLPQATAQPDGLRFPGARVSSSAHLTWDGEPVRVAVWTSTTGGSA